MSEERSLLTQAVAAVVMVALGGAGVSLWTQERVQGSVAMQLEHLTDSVDAIRYRVDRQQGKLELLEFQVIGAHNMRRLARIQGAMRQIDRDDPTQLTADGHPRVEAVEGILREASWNDWQISAQERDLACFLDPNCDFR